MRSAAIGPLVLVALVCAAAAPPVHGSDSANGAVVVTARFGPRTSLTVSSRVLRFDVANPSDAVQAEVDFSAAARTQAGAEVVLSVEREQAVSGPGGAADVETSITFTGEGNGTMAGTVEGGSPAIAGRWTGSGRRTGRLIFSLRAGASGSYTLPVRFVLSSP
ncbi:MAG: hypothetical protein WD227_10610 [Vicinamibacterales bacterium]